MTFKSHHGGNNDLYSIRRDWAARGTTVVETIDFTRNGCEVDDIPREDWDHYLEDMIPAGVSQLFFFDGEKIQDIADDEANIGLFDAIRSLLGLDIIDQLRGDLALYKARAGDSTGGYDIEAIQRDLTSAREEVVLQEEMAASLTAKCRQLTNKSNAAQRIFQHEGGTIAISRETLTEELNTTDHELKTLEADLKNLANGHAPFALAPKLTTRFLSEVERAKGAQFEKAVSAFVLAFKETVNIRKGKPTKWTAKHFTDLQDYAAATKGADDIIELSAEPDWIVQQFEGVSDERVLSVQLASQLSGVWQRRGLLREQLKNFRPGAAADAFKNLREAEFNRGASETELARITTEVDRLRGLSTRLDNERTKAINAKDDHTRNIQRMDMATRTQAALADYEQRILQKRLSSLSEHFVDAFNGLVPRKTLVSSVEVDPETFVLKLRDSQNKIIRTDSLSAGERQLYAIAMLWALGKTSGRELPMIIDTPLSRLDMVHRKTLMGEYLPKASKQVIMLCTDTELTDDIEELVAPYVSRTFEIGVGGDGTKTSISQLGIKANTVKEVLINAG